MSRLIRLIYKNERGITLIELTLAIAIVAILTTGFTMTFHQVATANARSAAHMTAVKQVESALYWINRDVQMSQEIVTGNDPAGTGFPLTLSWTDYSGNNDYQAIYSLVDNVLVRTYTVTGSEPSGPTDTTVAEYISMDSANTNCQYSEGVVDLTFTASVGDTYLSSETRTYQVKRRTDSS